MCKERETDNSGSSKVALLKHLRWLYRFKHLMSNLWRSWIPGVCLPWILSATVGEWSLTSCPDPGQGVCWVPSVPLNPESFMLWDTKVNIRIIWSMCLLSFFCWVLSSLWRVPSGIQRSPGFLLWTKGGINNLTAEKVLDRLCPRPKHGGRVSPKALLDCEALTLVTSPTPP